MKDNQETIKQSFCPYPVYMPDGRPAPVILTEEELITLLRLDKDSGGPKNPAYTLAYYRKHGLRAIQMGKRIRYFLPDVLDFLSNQSVFTNRKTEETKRKNVS
jgi:hypothetical protein